MVGTVVRMLPGITCNATFPSDGSLQEYPNGGMLQVTQIYPCSFSGTSSCWECETGQVSICGPYSDFWVARYGLIQLATALGSSWVFSKRLARPSQKF